MYFGSFKKLGIVFEIAFIEHIQTTMRIFLMPKNINKPPLFNKNSLTLVIGSMSLMIAASASASEPAIGSLKNEAISLPDLSGIVKNTEAAEKLGKALFWDQLAGSDGMACGSCHFAAGADDRTSNMLSPGLSDIRDFKNSDNNGGEFNFGGLVKSFFQSDDQANQNNLSPESTKNLRASGLVSDANLALVPEDFPFHQLADVNDRNSEIFYTTNDVASSQGTFDALFKSVRVGDNDKCSAANATVFHTTTGYAARRVEPRNTPTMINAIFNHRNFWDGRANNVFNGVDQFGERNKNARIVILGEGGEMGLQKLALKNASLASQAVGPTLSDFEMSCAGRIFPQVGQKLIPIRALKEQEVHPKDSLLNGLVDDSGLGLNITYEKLIKDAFEPKYWGADNKARYQIDSSSGSPKLVEAEDGFTQMELNFSMFWGVAIMLYEATLVSDDSPFDQYKEGSGTLSESAKRGETLFLGKAQCVNCHDTAAFSNATTLVGDENKNRVARMLMAGSSDGAPNPAALYDSGYYNIGVTPTVQDFGLGAEDPWGNPLSFTRQYVWKLFTGEAVDRLDIDECAFEVTFGEDVFDTYSEFTTLGCEDGRKVKLPEKGNALGTQRVVVDGSFKTPILRNVGLTPPYMHNGGFKSLKEVVQFYNRGGNTRGDFKALKRTDDGSLVADWEGGAHGDTSGTGFLGNPFDGFNRTSMIESQNLGSNLAPNIVPLGLSEHEQDDLVNFLLALTDHRVSCRQAPFDGPELRYPEEQADELSELGGNRGADVLDKVVAVGADGLPAEECIENNGNLFGGHEEEEEVDIGLLSGSKPVTD